MLTGISGSNTVLMRLDDRRLERGRLRRIAARCRSSIRSARRRRLRAGVPGGSSGSGFIRFDYRSRRRVAAPTAAFSVCHARLAHFTRAGNSRTPAKHGQLAEVLGDRRVGRRRDHACETARTAPRASATVLPFTRVGHQRRRRLRDRAARALEADVRDDVAVERQVQRQPVAAQRVVALGVRGWRRSIARKFRGRLLWSRMTSW